jgi:hypothetical protein
MATPVTSPKGATPSRRGSAARAAAAASLRSAEAGLGLFLLALLAHFFASL